MRRHTFAVIAGGGTGGHVMPGIAVAQALMARGVDAEHILFVGGRHGPESTLVPSAGFSFVALPGRGLQRRSWRADVAAAVALAAAAVRAVVLLARLRPSVVVAVGGYASAACVVGAVLLRRPLVVMEQNAVPGRVNQFAARFAQASAVSFDGTPLRRSVVTGNPVRSEITALVDAGPEERLEARRVLGLPSDRTVVLAFPGSLGSGRINDAVLAWASEHRTRTDLAVFHIAGARQYDDVVASMAAGEPPSGLVHRVVGFEHRIATALAAADVAVARASSGVLAELACAGVPAVLVPWAGAAHDHQSANARAVERAGAGVVVADRDLDGASLGQALDPLIDDSARRTAMAAAMRALARPAAAAAVADLLVAHAKGGLR